MKRNLKRALEIGEASSDPKLKLEALKIANDSHKFIIELATNGVVVANAINYVNRQRERIEEIKMLDTRIEKTEQVIEENEQTSNSGIY